MNTVKEIEAGLGEKPLCFILMPFGVKSDPTGGPDIDFNAVYELGIKPGILDAGLEPLRADEEKLMGIIHKPMFERLLLADFAVADMTTGNANVFYELGVRHTARPATTLTLFASHQPIPFDVNFLRSVAYEMGSNNNFGKQEAQELRKKVASSLKELRNQAQKNAPVDSPVFQLLGDWQPGDIARLKTDSFRQRIQFNEDLKAELEAARNLGKEKGSAELSTIENRISFDAVEAGVLVDLLLSRRALSDWDGMISLFEKFPEVLKRQVLTREQLAFALNRRAGENDDDGDRTKAVRILQSIIDDRGPNSETCGLIGRIHKDRWAKTKGDNLLAARGHLKLAIKSYVQGFRSDWRDAYPGINAVTLLDIEGSESSTELKADLLPVVKFAAKQRIETKEPDYWDHATLLEIEVLNNNQEEALDHLANALAVVREEWEPATTANNLKLIEQARSERNEDTGWLKTIIAELSS